MSMMVDPSGAMAQGAQAPVTTFDSTGATPTELVSAASGTVGMSSSVNDTSAEAAKSSVAAVKLAAQKAINSESPRDILLGMGFILLLIMLIVTPRFVARIFATRFRGDKNKPHPHWSEKYREIDSPESRSRKTAGGDLDQGWILRSGPKPSARTDTSFWASSQDPFQDPFTVPTFPTGADERHSFIGPAPTTTVIPTMSPPPHVAPMLQKLPFSSKLMYAPFARLPWGFGTGLNIPQIIMVLAYFAIIAVAIIWKSDVSPEADKSHSKDYKRTGYIAMSQVPIVIALGARSNVFGMLVAKGHEKLKVFHKIMGRVIFLTSTLHTFYYLWKEDWKIEFTSLTIQGGSVAWLGVVIIGLTSLPWIRQRFYMLFKVTHILGTFAFVIGLGFHVSAAVPWCLAAGIIYAATLLFSLLKTRIAHADIAALSNDTTLISMSGLRSGWRAGQHVRIRVPALGPEAHPFTIASAPNGEGMVLLCKVAGGWTGRLHALASKAAADPEKSTGDRHCKAKIIVEGPYGGLGNTLLPSFSAVFLAAAGSGITYVLSLAHDLVMRAPTGVVRARTVDLVWVVKNEEMATPLFATLIDLVKDARTYEEKAIASKENPAPVALRVHIYLTRCPTSSPLPRLVLPPSNAPANPFMQDWEKTALNRALTASRKTMSKISIKRGKPDFKEMVRGLTDEVLDRTGRRKIRPRGICATACGAPVFVHDVSDATRSVDNWKRCAVGGIEMEEESFAF